MNKILSILLFSLVVANCFEIPADVRERIAEIQNQKAGPAGPGRPAGPASIYGKNGCLAGVSRNASTLCCGNETASYVFVDLSFGYGKKQVQSLAQGQVDQNAKPPKPKPGQPGPKPTKPPGYYFSTKDGKGQTQLGFIAGGVTYAQLICLPAVDFQIQGVGNWSFNYGLSGGVIFNFTDNTPFAQFLGFNTSFFATAGALNCGPKKEAFLFGNYGANSSVTITGCDNKNVAVIPAAPYVSSQYPYQIQPICLPTNFTVTSSSQEWELTRYSDFFGYSYGYAFSSPFSHDSYFNSTAGLQVSSTCSNSPYNNGLYGFPDESKKNEEGTGLRTFF